MHLQRAGSFCAAAMLAAVLATSARAEETKPNAPAAASEEQKPPDKGVAQLVLLADQLQERSAALQREIEGLFDRSASDAALAELVKNLTDLSARLSRLRATQRYNYDQVVQIKTAALADSKTVKRLLDSINQSALQLETWTSEWQKEKKGWTDLRATLPKDVPQNVLKPLFMKGQQAIESALSLLTRQLAPVLETQQKFTDQKTRLGKLTLELDSLTQRAIKNMFRRTGPSMLSPDYYSQLVKSPSYDFQIMELASPVREYFSRYAWAVALQAIAFLLIAHGIRRHRNFLEGHQRWGFISSRPMAAGLFAAVIFLGWLPGVPKPLALRLASLALIGLSTARLVGGLIPDRRGRIMLYVLAVLLVMTEALRILDFPLPLFRLYTFLVALGGLLFGIRKVFKEAKPGSRSFLWLSRAGTALCAVALFAELSGYNGLSTDLVENSLKSILTLTVCWIVMVLIRGTLEWALGAGVVRSIAILQNKAEVILRRSTRIIGFFLALFLVAANLSIWGLYDSPVAALQSILALGFSIGTWKMTLGLVLTAAVILYGALLASDAVQTAITEGLFTLREVQVGARFSMARLIHYAFMLIGILFALGVLGVDLKNITILAGALGVGIGFGLQGIVNNFVSGLILLFERPVKVGDLVEIDSQWAQIKKIGLRATIVETFDQAEVVVPNSELINNRVKNWTLTNRASRMTIPVGVAYGTEVSAVMQMLRECAEEHPLVLKNRQPGVFFIKFGESSLDFELRVYTDVDHRLKVQSELLQAIDRRFREAGVEIPFPQRELRIRSEEIPASAKTQKSDSSRAQQLKSAG